MYSGQLEAIFICPEAGKPMVAVNQVRAVPGQGLEGDRYFREASTFSKQPGTDQEVTLIEIEAIAALEKDYGINFGPGDSRRNLVTRGVPLNHLVGQEFKVGAVTLKGVRLCEPCSHLARLTQKEVLPALVHRGGLRAQILTEGIIQPGATISPSGG
jgi:MOSC domain-containing protein YiiM